MLQVGGYVFKRAETDDEFDQIHALNYRTFVGEIPQHADTGTGRLVDKFHHKNTYFIALQDTEVVGMVSVHGQPPFSIADRLPDPGLLERPGTRPLEVRLLAIKSEKRHSVVYSGLVWTLFRYAQDVGATHLFISGVQERLSLYEQLGFERIGPPVQGGRAVFIPMAVRVSNIAEKKHRAMQLWIKRLAKRGSDGETTSPESGTRSQEADEEHDLAGPRRGPAPASVPRGQKVVCLLPGPVTIAPEVHAAFHRMPIYHRGPDFLELFEKVRGRLARMVGCRNVAIFNGSGTLGNEVVAATLAAEPRPTNGVILVNGEFGQRLVRQAARFGLSFDVLSWPWGKPWNLGEIERRVTSNEWRVDWVWGVHQESSTGVLNDLAGLIAVARRAGCKVCADCISSLGATPLDLRDVYLASGATGKALGSYAGAALVFADLSQLGHLDLSRVPSYLDLPAALRTTGPRYTFPSSTLLALETALESFATPEKAHACYDRYRQLGAYVRSRLRQVGLPPLADEDCAAPVITTFAPPADETSEGFVARCHTLGYAIGGASGYLQERRLVQIATMGAVRQEDVAPLFDHLHALLVQRSSSRLATLTT
ncbi:MAG: aminotransferase class V-fold PLP-dependent enzyme [Planctomycetes bacterium]|nr:aminotransferase class V-fold PLP-dependent enzyme [Planctomycetota bacterium]